MYTDLCGKMNAKSLSGAEYFLTFTDDYTHYVWVYALKHKANVFKKFLEWKGLVKRSTGRKVKVLRSDNGGEYISKEFQNYLTKEGIGHQLAAPKAPKQNGTDESHARRVSEVNAVRCRASA